MGALQTTIPPFLWQGKCAAEKSLKGGGVYLFFGKGGGLSVMAFEEGHKPLEFHRAIISPILMSFLR